MTRDFLIGLAIGGVPVAAYALGSLLADWLARTLKRWHASRQARRLVATGHYTEAEAEAKVRDWQYWAEDRLERLGR